MLIVIFIMLLGVAFGYVFKNVKFIGNISKSISVTIFLLLLFLGIGIGSNEAIVKSLPKLGWQALSLALAASLGSAIFAWVVYICFFKDNKKVKNR